MYGGRCSLAMILSLGFQSLGELGFDFLDRRQAGVERLGQGADKLVFGDAHGLGDAGEGVFRHEAFLGFADQQADGGLSSEALICASTAAR